MTIIYHQITVDFLSLFWGECRVGYFQGPTLVFWAQVELDKSTWQVALVKLTCHPHAPAPLKSLEKWQLVKSTCQVNLKGDPPKITSASCPKHPRGVLGGGVRWRSWPKKRVKIDHFLNFSCTLPRGSVQGKKTLGLGFKTSSTRVIEGGMRHRQVHVFELCRLFFSHREGDYIQWGKQSYYRPAKG